MNFDTDCSIDNPELFIVSKAEFDLQGFTLQIGGIFDNGLSTADMEKDREAVLARLLNKVKAIILNLSPYEREEEPVPEKKINDLITKTIERVPGSLEGSIREKCCLRVELTNVPVMKILKLFDSLEELEVAGVSLYLPVPKKDEAETAGEVRKRWTRKMTEEYTILSVSDEDGMTIRLSESAFLSVLFTEDEQVRLKIHSSPARLQQAVHDFTEALFTLSDLDKA